MKGIWKYTLGLAIELIIKVLQQLIETEDTVIPGTGSNAKAKDIKK